MTIGISKERLEDIVNKTNCDLDTKFSIRYLLDYECTELNQWKRIDEDTPKDRPLLMWHEPSGQPIIAYRNYPNCTKWQELPADPK